MRIAFTTDLPQQGLTRLSAHTLYAPLSEADILVSTFDKPVTAAMIASAPNLRLIANFGAGYNNIDLEACRARGIRVTNTPQPVIEPSLYGKTLGIIGMGRIGQALARRAVAGGMQIIYHNRHRLPEEIEAQYGARYVDFGTLLQDSDYVSLNLPYTPEVRHLIGKQELGMMKRSAYLINTARGAHVDELSLIEALKNGIIAGAAMDVYEHEPQISPELLTLPNVVLSPHTGTGTWEGRIAMCENVADNILAFINNEQNKMNIVL